LRKCATIVFLFLLFTLIIIVAVSGGFASAIQANELGLKTLMINSGLPLGGTCVNVGCVPSKALIHYAKTKQLNFPLAIEKKLELVAELRKENGKKIIKFIISGKEEEIAVDEILLAAGKTPNTDDLDLEKAKVKVNERKAIATNKFLQTTNPNIHAVGDVNDLY
jgi:pyruvate/2-oxoglutarate dehydrogenase complex dihydrolipoamide dehydrogenase (E3) component